MDQDLTVFVSSYIDKSPNKELKEERESVERLIESMLFVTPWVFETEPASPKDPVAYCRDSVENCHILVLLLDKTLRKGVKDEYEKAVASGKTILVFIKDGTKNNDMEAFIAEIYSESTCKTFFSTEELKRYVREAINSEIRSMIQPDWRPIQMEKAERFRKDRTENIRLNKTKIPIPFRAGAKIILQLVPQDALTSNDEYEIGELRRVANGLNTMLSGVGRPQSTFDGYISYSSIFDNKTMDSYVLLCRNGILEATACLIISSNVIETPYCSNAVKIPTYERELKKLLPQYLAALKVLGVKLPIYLFLTLTGIEGTALWYDRLTVVGAQLIATDPLSIKKQTIRRYDDPEHLLDVLRKCFDRIANSWGYDYSKTFDKV